MNEFFYLNENRLNDLKNDVDEYINFFNKPN